jgi:Fe-S-cluster-containing hydrogenase component 2
MQVSISNSRCDRSPACVAARVCPRDAIVPVRGGAYPGAEGYSVVKERCAGCAVCVMACPFGAVTLEG